MTYVALGPHGSYAFLSLFRDTSPLRVLMRSTYTRVQLDSGLAPMSNVESGYTFGSSQNPLQLMHKCEKIRAR